MCRSSNIAKPVLEAGNKKRGYVIVTLSYWAFTVSDGALRMLVLGYFHHLGYGPLELSALFLLYELFGVFTNLASGEIGSRKGLHITLIIGLLTQICALVLLALHSPSWDQALALFWVMGIQALSGIAKDFTKMSSKTAVKFLAKPKKLFGVVAVLTGSKNSLKGLGFFVGAILLERLGFDMALYVMAALLTVVLAVAAVFGDRSLGKVQGAESASSASTSSSSASTSSRSVWRALLSSSEHVNRLSLARFFLFGARDVWFVVALPLFFSQRLGWSFSAVGTFMAVWVIAYGFFQAAAPKLMSRDEAAMVAKLPVVLAGFVLYSAALVLTESLVALSVIFSICVFGFIFALISSAHSYLILAYSQQLDQTAKDVGFYYASNALGRLVGTALSGVSFLVGGIVAALVVSAAMLLISGWVGSKLVSVQSG